MLEASKRPIVTTGTGRDMAAPVAVWGRYKGADRAGKGVGLLSGLRLASVWHLSRQAARLAVDSLDRHRRESLQICN